MTTARDKLKNRIQKMTTELIKESTLLVNKPWEKSSIEEKIVRTELLNEYENRCGEDALDKFMDELEQLA